MINIIKSVSLFAFICEFLRAAPVLAQPKALGIHNHSVVKTLTYRWNSGNNLLKSGMTFAHKGTFFGTSPQAEVADSTDPTLAIVRGFVLSAGDAPHQGPATNATLQREFDAIIFGEIDGFVDLTPGANYFAVGNTGQIGLFADITVGHYVVPVGYAMTETKLFFIPPSPPLATGLFPVKV